MKKVLGVLLLIISTLGGLYVGGWILFIKPIIDCCKAFDAGTLTGIMVGWTVIKCLLASTVGGLIAVFGSIISTNLLTD